MLNDKMREALRRVDVACALRARGLGVRREPRDAAETEEKCLRMQEALRRMQQERDGFNR